LPARSALESVARLYAQDWDIPTTLAFYRVAGRLDVAADPALQAARRWLADKDAVIVVHDEDQKQRVHAALSELTADSTSANGFLPGDKRSADRSMGGAPDPIAKAADRPRILQAETAYELRREQRRKWQKQSRISHGHIVEPGVIEKAYVLAPSSHNGGTRYDSLTRGLSVPAEAHLISYELDPWTAVHVNTETKRLEQSMAARARAEHVRQAAVSAELQRARERDVQREIEHHASREAERV
jgi:hypothetical protein